MQKKIVQQAKTQPIRSGSVKSLNRNRIQASSAGVPITTRELIREKPERDSIDYVSFFDTSNNVYINDLARRARRSSTHSAILSSKLSYTVGTDFIFDPDLKPNEQSWVDDINAKGETLRDLFKKAGNDYITFGNAWIQSVKVQGRTNYYHIDATKVRIKKDRSAIIVSDYWREIGNGTYTSKPHVEISLNPKKSTHAIQLMRHSPEYNFYGLPDYIGALNWIDVEYRIPKFNLDRFDNGFFPSALIQMFGAPPEGTTAKQYVKSMVSNFTGEANNSKIVAEMLDSPEQAAKITTFDSEKQGEFEKLAEMSKVNIITAHRIPPVLAMIETAGKLGGNQQISESHNLFMNSVIIPDFQEPLLRFFNALIKAAGFKFTIEINQLNSLTLVDKINPNDVLTINEQRVLLGYEEIETTEENGN
jgi:hypothetical protein